MNETKINWVSRKEAANLAGVTVRTIDRWATAGYLTRHVNARGRIGFDSAQVRAMNQFDPETAGTTEVQA